MVDAGGCSVQGAQWRAAHSRESTRGIAQIHIDGVDHGTVDILEGADAVTLTRFQEDHAAWARSGR